MDKVKKIECKKIDIFLASGMVEPLAALVGGIIFYFIPYYLSYFLQHQLFCLWSLFSRMLILNFNKTKMQKWLRYALSFAAGAMIYVVFDDIVPEAQRSNFTTVY
jgi:zinc transporter ZupT